MKVYLANPPILVPRTLGLPLILYLTVEIDSLGAMLEQSDDTR